MITLVCLHGWGGSHASFTELQSVLDQGRLRLLVPDLPGFGTTPPPADPIGTADYAAWVRDWVLSHWQPDHGPLWLLGHSHGGRTALWISAQHFLPVERLFLCAAAGVSEPERTKKFIGLLLSKSGKWILGLPGLQRFATPARRLLYRLLGVHDYERANPVMQRTLQRVTAERLDAMLPDIAVPTDLFWGTDDTQTPLSDGQRMHALIPQSRLHVFAGVRHAVHRARAGEIAAIVNAAALGHST